jgi:hypothetical protein
MSRHVPPPAAPTPPPLPHNAAEGKEVEVGEGVDKPSSVGHKKKSEGAQQKKVIYICDIYIQFLIRYICDIYIHFLSASVQLLLHNTHTPRL